MKRLAITEHAKQTAKCRLGWNEEAASRMAELAFRKGVSHAATPGKPGDACPRGVTAYLSIYNSVKGESGLIHGRLYDGRGNHCAIGSFFYSVDKNTALPSDLIDEVATVNDSCRSFTPKQRRKAVLQWLRWKLDTLGYRMPGRKPAQAK